MPDSLRKAVAIRDGARPLDVLGGPKVRAFYRALTTGGAEGPPVIDRWMFRVLEIDTIPECQAAVLEAAHAVGERPHDMQAILWVAVRGGAE